MKVGELVGERHGLRRASGLVLARWAEVQPGINIEETWCEVLWDDGTIAPQLEHCLEKVNASR